MVEDRDYGYRIYVGKNLNSRTRHTILMKFCILVHNAITKFKFKDEQMVRLEIFCFCFNKNIEFLGGFQGGLWTWGRFYKEG